MMQEYEITYLVPSEDVFKQKPVENIIEKIGGKVISSTPWGMRNLAYTIRKNNVAFIVTDVFSVDRNQIPKLDSQLRLNNNVIRFLIVKDVHAMPEPEKETKRDFEKKIARPTPKPIVKPVIITDTTIPVISKTAKPSKAKKAPTVEKPKEKMITKKPVKKEVPAEKPVKKPSTAPSDEERLKQLESKLQDLLKE